MMTGFGLGLGGLARTQGVGGSPNIAQTPYPVYFETQRVNGEFYETSGVGNDYSIKRSNNGLVQHFDVLTGDKAIGDGTVDRCELSNFNVQKAFGSEFWGSWGFMVEPVSATYPSLDGTSICHVGQLHTDQNGSPVVAFLLTGDSQLDIKTRSGTSAVDVTVTRYTNMAFQRGRRYQVVMHCKTDPAGAGLLQVWIDGVLVVDVSSVPIGYTDRSTTFWKFGLYRSSSTTGRMGAFYWNMDFDAADKTAKIAAPDAFDPGSVFVDMWKIDPLGTGLYVDTVDRSVYTFADVPLLGEQFDRYVALALWVMSAGTQDITSVTIQPKVSAGGATVGSPIAITMHSKSGNTASTSRSIVGSASVPLGAYADIVVTADGTLSNCEIAPFRLQGIMSNTPIDTPTSVSTTPSLAFNGHGLVVSAAKIGSAAQTAAWVGATKVANDNTPEGSISISRATAKLVDDSVTAVSLSWSGGSSGARAALAMWR